MSGQPSELLGDHVGRILIVDDKPANLLALESILEPLQRPIVRAGSGEAALLHILKADFAVIVLDVFMPGLDGMETAALIRERERSATVPIIFVTAEIGELDRIRHAYALGAVDFIVKPVDPLILRSKVGTFIKLHEQAQALRFTTTTLATESDRRIEAEEAVSAKDLFIGILGHDLRSPLAVLLTGVELLQRSPGLDAHRPLLRRMARSVDRMDRLIRDVLDFARLSAGEEIPVTADDGDCGELAREVVDEFRQSNPSRTIDVEISGTVDGACDRDRVAQVLSNLIGNALQHSTTDPVRVSVVGTADRVTIVVSNPGRIDPEIVPRLFEPFRRGSASVDGLGLGLYIVRAIARAHGGTVDVSTEGDTTSFTVDLPRRPRAKPDA